MLKLFKILPLISMALLVACSQALDGKLHQSVRDGDLAQVKVLINQNANVNSKENCMTPLMEAVIANYPEIVTALMKANANEDIRDCTGATAMSYALRTHNQDMVALLVRKGEPLYEKYSPAPPPNSSGTHEELNNKLHELAFRMDYSDNPAVVDRDEDAAAAIALIKAGADVNALDSTGATPLMRAAFIGHIKVMKALVDNNANVNLQDNNGTTALMWAAEAPDEKAVKLLLADGALPNIKDKYGETVLSNIQIKTDQEYLPVKHILKKAGAR